MSSIATRARPATVAPSRNRSLISWKPKNPLTNNLGARPKDLPHRNHESGGNWNSSNLLTNSLRTDAPMRGQPMRHLPTAVDYANPVPTLPRILDNKTNSKWSVLEIRNAEDQQTSRCHSPPIPSRLCAFARVFNESSILERQGVVDQRIPKGSFPRSSPNVHCSALLKTRFSRKEAEKIVHAQFRPKSIACQYLRTPTNCILSTRA